MEIKSAKELNAFRDTVDNCKDKDMIEAAIALLEDRLKVNRMKREIEQLEAGMYDGAKSLFYFLTLPLSDDELVYAAERSKGRLTRIKREEDLKNPPKLENKNTEDEENP